MLPMKLFLTCTALVVTASLATSGAQTDTAALATQVAAVERAFAKTMADRDHAGFVSFLSDETVFVPEGGQALRGKQAVAAAWKRFYDGAQAPVLVGAGPGRGSRLGDAGAEQRAGAGSAGQPRRDVQFGVAARRGRGVEDRLRQRVPALRVSSRDRRGDLSRSGSVMIRCQISGFVVHTVIEILGSGSVATIFSAPHAAGYQPPRHIDERAGRSTLVREQPKSRAPFPPGRRRAASSIAVNFR